MPPRPPLAVKFSAVVALAPLPLLILLPGAFAGHSDYAFAPVAGVGAILLARARLQRTPAVWPGNRRVGSAILAAAGIILLAAAVLESPWGAAMALILTMAALTWDFGGRPALRAVAPPMVLLALCIPLPLDLDRSAIAFMSRAAARWASHFLDVLGVVHVRSDQVLVYSGGRLDLAAQLGGPISPIALAALLIGLAQVRSSGFWRTVILTATGLAFLPVVTAAAATAQVAWAGGMPDLVWAAGSAALAVALAFSFDQWVGIPGSLALRPNPAVADVVATAPAVPEMEGRAVGRFAAAAFAGLAAVQIWAIAAPAPQLPPAPDDWFPERIEAERFKAWTMDRAARPDAVGAAAAANYRSGDRRLTLVVFPASGSPVADLEAQGWVVRGRATRQADDDPTIVAELELPAKQFATVWICGLATGGQSVAPPARLFGPAARAVAALRGSFGGSRREADWWVRAVFAAPWPPTIQDRVEPAAVFRKARNLLGSRLRSEGAP
jgi:hypothetical protein